MWRGKGQRQSVSGWKMPPAVRYISTMRRDEVISRLKQTEPALRELGVEALYVFGSHARDEAGPDSDIDVFIDPTTDGSFGFIPFMDAYEALQDAVGDKLDYGTRKGLHPLLRANIEREAIRVF